MAAAAQSDFNSASMTYTPMNATANPNVTAVTGQVAVRTFLTQDRIFYIERKFFCNKATEKTVWLNVRDSFNNKRTVKTNKVKKHNCTSKCRIYNDDFLSYR